MLMNDEASCEKSCTLSCEGTCPFHEHGVPSLAEVLERFEKEARQGICDTGRYRCNYFSWGEGPPLVFVHGLADSSRSFLFVSALLSRFFRCIAYDLPMGGRDGARLARYQNQDLCADLWALLDHLQLKQSYLFGSSFGSTIALMALHARPERIPRAILQAGLAHKPLRGLERPLALLLSYLGGTVASLPGRQRLMEKLHQAAFAQRPPDVWRYYLDYTGRVPVQALGHHARWLHRTDLRPLLRQIRQPVLLLSGETDTVVDASCADLLMQELPNGGRVILQGCGHIPSYTHPEALAEVVRRFLSPTPAPAPTCSALSEQS